MSQVQVRQVPLATSSDAQRIAGSWYPSGFYGHFRAKSRAELCNYFRQLARPTPPKKFIDRQRAEATTHVFSRHDNRLKLESDPLVRGTQTGFGKRKSKTNLRGEFDPLFVSWIPKDVDRKTYVDNIKITAYGEDYNRDQTPSRMLADVQATETINNIDNENNNNGTDSKRSSSDFSMYATAYSHGQPNYELSKQIRQDTFQRYYTTRTRLSEQKHNDRSQSVASCLVWNSISDTTKPPITNNNNNAIINIVAPITLQPRISPNNNNSNTSLITSSPRQQRAQSAGPRLMSTPYNQSMNTIEKPYQSQSMQTFKSPITILERPHTATTTSRDHYKGANFGLKIVPPPRATTSFEQTHTNSMDSLVAKYM